MFALQVWPTTHSPFPNRGSSSRRIRRAAWSRPLRLVPSLPTQQPLIEAIEALLSDIRSVVGSAVRIIPRGLVHAFVVVAVVATLALAWSRSRGAGGSRALLGSAMHSSPLLGKISARKQQQQQRLEFVCCCPLFECTTVVNRVPSPFLPCAATYCGSTPLNSTRGHHSRDALIEAKAEDAGDDDDDDSSLWILTLAKKAATLPGPDP